MTDRMHEWENTPCGLFYAEDDGRLRRINAHLAELLGSDPEALRGVHVDRILSVASRIVFHSHVDPALKLQGEVGPIEVTLKGAAGRETEALLNARRSADPNGVLSIRGALFPLHHQRRLESQLVRAQQLIENLPGVAFQLVLRPDGSCAIPYANEALRTLHGLSPESVSGNAAAFWHSIHPDDEPEVRRSLLEAAHQLSSWHARFRTRAASPTRHLDTRAAPQRLADGSVLFSGYTYDATEQLRIEELLRAKAVIERASDAKTRFLGRVSHEIRNPLTALLGASSLLGSDTSALRERDRGLVSLIENAGTQLLALVDELLDISQIESGIEALRLEPVELCLVLSAALELMQATHRVGDVHFDFDVPYGLIVKADARRLKQVALNLISNAIKYNRPGGTVYVRATRAGDKVQFSIRDQGKGIGPDQLDKLFQPFNRLGVDERIQGTGLGLVITRTLLEHMGGTITVSSTPGVGSCFTAELPACRPAEDANPRLGAPSGISG